MKKLEDFIKLIPPHTTLDITTFKGMREKSRFIDEKYGEFWAYCYNIARGHCHPGRRVERIKEGCERIHGVKNVMQKRDILIKNHSQQWKVKGFHHWKTGEPVFCTGTYEKKVVGWLNFNKIDFDWQIPFKMDDGSTYFIDLYLIEKDLYVEIKGRWNKRSWEKWTEFHSKYPNSEVWDKTVLRQMGLIYERKRRS